MGPTKIVNILSIFIPLISKSSSNVNLPNPIPSSFAVIGLLAFAPTTKNSYMEIQNKRQKSKQEDDRQLSNRIEGLPRDVIIDIVCRLPLKSIIRFRFVCTTFYKLSHDSDLVHMNLSRALKSNPYLIFHSDYPLSNHLYFVEYPDRKQNKEVRVRKFHTPFSTSMPEFHVVGSCDGMLCLVNSLFNDVVYIYNPFTGQDKELPRSTEFEHQMSVYGFGSHPITKEYKVIKIIHYANMYNASLSFHRLAPKRYIRSEVQVFSLGGTRWRSIGEAPYQLDSKSTAALVNGRLHWVSKYSLYQRGHAKRIISFDISDERFREVPQPDCMARVTMSGYHLAVLSGCLSMALPIRERRGGFDIWVMKEYDVKESWVKQFRIDGYMPKLRRIAELRRSHRIWKKALLRRPVRVLCVSDDGEILIEYKGGALAAYNPECGTFTDLSFQGMPNLFRTITHVGSLNWVR